MNLGAKAHFFGLFVAEVFLIEAAQLYKKRCSIYNIAVSENLVLDIPDPVPYLLKYSGIGLLFMGYRRFHKI